MENIQVKFKKLNPEAVVPTYAHEGDAGADITGISFEYDKFRDAYIYHTGLAVEIPKGYVMLIFPRSSNRDTDAYLPNSIGVIDSGYRGEILVTFKNRDGGEDTVQCNPYNIGSRIGQAIIIPYPKVSYILVDELSDSDRGTGGHGSTGK